MRLFFAYWPSAQTARDIYTWVERAHQLYGGRMMRLETLHMTLAFLGTVEPERADELAQSCRDWVLPAGSMRLGEPGRFPSAKVVWLGPQGADTPAMAWLRQGHDRLWAHLAPMGYQPRESTFRPHVSLLRNAGAGDLAALSGPVVPWSPQRCVLVASRPSASGSDYTVLADVPVSDVA